jgi:hypothetical protein
VLFCTCPQRLCKALYGSAKEAEVTLPRLLACEQKNTVDGVKLGHIPTIKAVQVGLHTRRSIHLTVKQTTCQYKPPSSPDNGCRSV